MVILGVIPARGGSKRLPGKNLRRLGGKTLLEWAINGARESKKLTHLVVSTEDDLIGAEAHRLGVEVLWRPWNLAYDSTPMVDVMRNVAQRIEADYYVCLQPTTPFRSGFLIDLTIQQLVIDQGQGPIVQGDSAVVVNDHQPTGEVYITTKAILSAGRLLGPQCRDLNWHHGILNIDTEYDLVRAERIVRQPDGVGRFSEQWT